MRKKLCALAVSLTLILMSLRCDVTQEIKSNHPQPAQGKIVVAAAEHYPGFQSVQDPIVALAMRTEKIYGCINYQIVYSFAKLGNRLDLNIEGVEIGEICLDALGPATAIEFLDLPNDSYTLRIGVRTGGSYAGDRYTFIITDATISLIPGDTTVSRVDGLLHWRYPRGSFAYYSGTYTGDEWLSRAFEDTLRKHVPLQEITVPPVGIWPYALSSAGYYYDAPARFYRYAKEADYDSAGALLSAFSRTVLKDKAGAGFYLVNWRNKSFYSWILQDR